MKTGVILVVSAKFDTVPDWEQYRLDSGSGSDMLLIHHRVCQGKLRPQHVVCSHKGSRIELRIEKVEAGNVKDLP